VSGRVTVSSYRHLLEPPERGDCQDPECRTIVAWPEIGVLLVAMYADGDQSSWSRVCAACDERILRRWLAEQ
jgi:hypothetical protein